MAKTNMGMPAELSGKAETLLKQNGYLWDPIAFTFRRTRRVGEETLEQYLAHPHVISFEELSDHGLFESHATTSAKAAALEWLEQRVKAN